MKELILNIMSVVVGVVGVGLAIAKLSQQIVAERELSNRLRNRVDELSKLVIENNLDELIDEVKQVVDEMPKKRRGEILDALEQKSSKGKVDYLNKLLHMSGSNVNISAHG
jgi:hypothetical protein